MNLSAITECVRGAGFPQTATTQDTKTGIYTTPVKTLESPNVLCYIRWDSKNNVLSVASIAGTFIYPLTNSKAEKKVLDNLQNRLIDILDTYEKMEKELNAVVKKYVKHDINLTLAFAKKGGENERC